MSKLVDAARSGDIETLKTLTADKNIDINQQEERTGFTALHAAAVWGNTATVHWLLSETNIDPYHRDKAGRRAVDMHRTGFSQQRTALLEASFHKVYVGNETNTSLDPANIRDRQERSKSTQIRKNKCR